MIPFEAICDVETEKLEVQSRGEIVIQIESIRKVEPMSSITYLLADALKVACLHVRDTGDPYT